MKFHKKLLSKAGLLLFILTAASALAQMCDAPDAHPQADSAFDYVRAEIRALRWIRLGVEVSQSIPAPAAPGDPQRAKQAERRDTMATTLNNDYDCAARAVTPYKESKIADVHDSVEAIVNGIAASQENNRQVLEQLAAIDRARNASEVDPATMDRLKKLTASEDQARAMIVLGVKISAFALVRTKDDKPTGEPVAFTISARQHDILAKELGQVLKQREHNPSFIDACANTLSSLLARDLPTSKP